MKNFSATLQYSEDISLNIDQLDEFFIRAFKQCEEYFSQDKIQTYQSLPSEIPQLNCCFLVKKYGNSVDDILTSMCVSYSSSESKKQTENFKYKTGKFPLNSIKVRVIEAKNAEVLSKIYVSHIKGYYIVHAFSSDPQIQQQEQQQQSNQQQPNQSYDGKPIDINYQFNVKVPQVFINGPSNIGIPNGKIPQQMLDANSFSHEGGLLKQNIQGDSNQFVQNMSGLNSGRDNYQINGNQNYNQLPQQSFQRIPSNVYNIGLQQFPNQNIPLQQNNQYNFQEDYLKFNQGKEGSIQEINKNTVIQELITRNDFHLKEIYKLQEELEKKDKQIHKLETQVLEQKKTNSQLQQQIDDLKKDVNLIKDMKKFKDQIDTLNDSINHSDLKTKAVSQIQNLTELSKNNAHINFDLTQLNMQNLSQAGQFNSSQFSIPIGKTKSPINIQKEEPPVKKFLKRDNQDNSQQITDNYEEGQDSVQTNFQYENSHSPQFQEDSSFNNSNGYHHFNTKLRFPNDLILDVDFMTSTSHSTQFKNAYNQNKLDNLKYNLFQQKNFKDQYQNSVDHQGIIGWIKNTSTVFTNDFRQIIDFLVKNGLYIEYGIDEKTYIVIFPKGMLSNQIDVDISFTTGMPQDSDILVFYWYSK